LWASILAKRSAPREPLPLWVCVSWSSAGKPSHLRCSPAHMF
jgi:hypothetical protein